METSGKSISKIFLVLSKITLTAALLALGSLVAPFQIRSSPRLPRMIVRDCSPSANLKASATLDLPEPFGPTMEEMGASNSKVFFFAKDLNPDNSMDLRYIKISITKMRRLIQTPHLHLPEPQGSKDHDEDEDHCYRKEQLPSLERIIDPL